MYCSKIPNRLHWLERKIPLAILVFALALVPWMISQESLWLDEGDTALYAMQPTAGHWLRHLLTDKIADCQMPLTMWVAWLTTRWFGVSELALRSQNFLWATVSLIALYRAGQHVKNPWLPLVMVVQPFFWFYMDEARPYAAQIAWGSVLLCLLTSFPAGQKRPLPWLACFLAGIVALYSTSMLAAAVIIGVVAVLAISRPREIGRILSSNKFAVGAGLLAMGLLSIYYVWTLLKGAAGSRIWPADLKSGGFIFYEFTGCLGLGPSLDAIREHASSGLLASLIPQLLLPGCLFALLLGLLFWQLRTRAGSPFSHSLTQQSLSILVFVAVCMLLASIAIHKPLWARHFSSVLPFLVYLEADILAKAILSRRILPCLAVVALMVLLAISSFQIRCAPRFAKDDYREAARWAREALQTGKKVWWSAAEYTGGYYRVPLNLGGRTGGATVIHGSSVEDTLVGGSPDVIIATRSEVYDPAGGIVNYVGEHQYRLVAKPKNFRVYAKTPF